MIPVEKAKKLLLQHAKVLPAVKADLMSCQGSVLASGIIAPISLPSFHQSSVDGYAIRFSDLGRNKKIVVTGEVAAGSIYEKKLVAGQALRIFTGAPVPSGADTVVMQEMTHRENEFLVIHDPGLQPGANIRKKGTQVKKGKPALPAGTRIGPGATGFLKALGISTVKIIGDPRISILVTGSELVKPGSVLREGQVYESNTCMLEAALQTMHLRPDRSTMVEDHEGKIFAALKAFCACSDLLLVTGGISVGDFDFVGQSLEKLGAETIFYKVMQRPGKPLYFGKLGNTLIFALPGNPAAVLTCFYEYVYPVIHAMRGRKDAFLSQVWLNLSSDYSKKKGLSFFLKGKKDGDHVIPLEGQASYMLNSFALADCLIYLPAEWEHVRKGTAVEVHLLPVS